MSPQGRNSAVRGRSGGSGGTEVPPGRQPASWNFFVSLMSRHVRTLYSACCTGVLGSLPSAPVEFVLVAGSAPPRGCSRVGATPCGWPLLEDVLLAMPTKVSQSPGAPMDHSIHASVFQIILTSFSEFYQAFYSSLMWFEKEHPKHAVGTLSYQTS